MLIGREARNEIAKAIQESNFPSDVFELDEDEDRIILYHNPTGSRFGIMLDLEGFQAEWAILGEPPSSGAHRSAGVLASAWLQNLENVLNMPDLWGEVFGGGAQGPSEADPNTPFDATEQVEIAEWAADLEQNAAERYSLEEAQMKALTGTLRELVEASGRLGRKDWYNAALGAFVSLAVTHAVEGPAVQRVLEGMVSVLGHMFGHPIPQLGPGSIF